MIRTAKGARRTYFRNNNENCNKQSVWQTMLFSVRAPAVCSKALWSEVGWGWRVGGSPELGPFWGLVRWDYVLFLSSLTTSCLPTFSCPTAGQTWVLIQRQNRMIHQ